jgi:hypothetical protein
MWKLKFFYNFCVTLFSMLRNYDKRLWMQYRENGSGSRWKLPLRKLDIAHRKEKSGAVIMSKATAQQWEIIQAFTNTDDKKLQEDLLFCSVNLVTWITLLKMNDPIETAEDRQALKEAEKATVSEE